MSGDKVASTRKRVSQTLQLRNRVAISIRELERELRLPAPYKTAEEKKWRRRNIPTAERRDSLEERAHAFTFFIFKKVLFVFPGRAAVIVSEKMFLFGYFLCL